MHSSLCFIYINKISVSDQRSTCIRQIIDFRIRIEIIETQNLFEMENFLDKKKYHSLKLKFEERSLIFLENVKFSTQWWKIIHTNSDKVYARHYSRGKIYKCRSSTLFWYRNIDLVYFETRTISSLTNLFAFRDGWIGELDSLLMEIINIGSICAN